MINCNHQASDLSRVGCHVATFAEVDPYACLGSRIVDILTFCGNDASLADRTVKSLKRRGRGIRGVRRSCSEQHDIISCQTKDAREIPWRGAVARQDATLVEARPFAHRQQRPLSHEAGVLVICLMSDFGKTFLRVILELFWNYLGIPRENCLVVVL